MPRPFSIIEDELDTSEELQQKRKTLREIVDSSEPNSLRWARLPEVIQSGLLGQNYSKNHQITENLNFYSIKRTSIRRTSGSGGIKIRRTCRRISLSEGIKNPNSISD
jgi:hypothetical protein